MDFLFVIYRFDHLMCLKKIFLKKFSFSISITPVRFKTSFKITNIIQPVTNSDLTHVTIVNGVQCSAAQFSTQQP